MGKIRNIVYAVSVAAGFALVGKGSLEIYRFSNAQELIEDYQATSAYIELKTVADVDGNGELNELERKLMYARLDDNRYGPGGGNWLWEDIVQNTEKRISMGGRMYWTPKDRSRISHALSIYKNERDFH
ncbi:MAG TPA: hypothetical protein VJI32_02410 [Candidatus Nanoarchaeia archaeon]|nr:hypothetical protein [Candidatus Nanoarchaeia archaeon]